MWNEYSHLPNEIKQQHFDALTEYIEELRQKPQLKELFIEMTINCNEHCIHCGSSCGDILAENTLSDKEILTMLVSLRNDLAKANSPLPFLDITGGEPLVRNGVIDLMAKIHKLGYSWGMTSNGTLITKEVAEALRAAGMYSIGISVDGTKSTHDWFRQTTNSYERTLEGIDNLLAAGIEHVMLTTVVHKKNIHELEDLYKIILEHKVPTWRLTNMEPIGRALDHDELALSGDDYKYLMDFIVEKQADPNLQMYFTCNHYVGLDLEQKIRPWYFFCRAGLQVAAIQYDGTIGACLDIERRPELSYGNVRTDRIFDVWNERFEVFRERKEEKSAKCRKCEHKNNCKGGGFHTWDMERNEPRICMLEKIGRL